MNTVETIQAAIEKLVSLRDGNAIHHPGRWLPSEELWSGSKRWEVAREDEFGRIIPVSNDGDGIGSFDNTTTVDLIVTLHATIDAQLAILQRSLDWFTEEAMAYIGPEDLALARAILGQQVAA